jgi:two-component system, cell cycle sensor histidine kinase and response regulator CckA
VTQDPDPDAIRVQRMDAASRMARVLAHEIANYLGSARTMLSLLGEELGPDPQAKEDLDVVVRTVESATRLVGALRGFAHAPTLGAGPADLNAVLREAEPALRALLPAGKNLRLEVAQEPLAVLADAAQLAQLALDLVACANHALPVGGRIDVSTERAARGAGGLVALLVVRDDGPGLDPATAARLFEPFVFDVAHDTGLRLSTVYATVTRSGGTISADSTPGAGTAFRVALPLAPARPRGVAQ